MKEEEEGVEEGLEGEEDFLTFCQVCERIASTPKKLEKIHHLASYLKGLSGSSLKWVCRMLSGYIFPKWSGKEVFAGPSSLASIIQEISGVDDPDFTKTYLKYGDLGSAAEELLGRRSINPLVKRDLTLKLLYQEFERMAGTSGPGSTEERRRILKGLLLDASPLEAKYLTRLLSKELRIGLVEALVEEALAKAFGRSIEEVRGANLVLADIGETALLARANRLYEASLKPLHPTNFMLAESLPTAKDVVEYHRKEVFAEFKYDGIRCQAHKAGGEVRLFTRHLEDSSEAFPEVVKALEAMKGDFVVDGEIVPLKEGRPLAFHLLQHRLRRKRLAKELMDEVPITYLVFDLLYLEGKVLLKEPLWKRRSLLESMDWQRPVIPSHLTSIRRADELERWFDESKAKGFEGVVVKDPSSPYEPGRRGKYWIKLKRELDTLDVVIVAAEFGHGKRAGLLSDYTFAVRDEEGELKVVGKAYSGLTDQEIYEMTEKLKALTIKDLGYKRIVQPSIVLEVAFDGIQRSDRHDSGYALRFPRIKRIRLDKGPADIDTLEKVRRIYEAKKEGDAGLAKDK